MNKTRISACAALIAGLFILNAPLDAAVESPVVGYTTMTMEAGKWYQIGMPFLDLEGEQTYQISEAFNTGFTSGDILFVMNPETCTYPVMRRWNDGKGWCKMAAPIKEDATIKAGQAVMIRKQTKSDVTFYGMVKAETQTTLEGDRSWNLVVLQHPVATTINSLQWSGLESTDILFIMDVDKATYPTMRRWQGTKKWCKMAAPITEDADLGVGQAMLIYKQSSGTATVSFQ